jgi:hypothetical protein
MVDDIKTVFLNGHKEYVKGEFICQTDSEEFHTLDRIYGNLVSGKGITFCVI